MVVHSITDISPDNIKGMETMNGLRVTLPSGGDYAVSVATWVKGFWVKNKITGEILHRVTLEQVRTQVSLWERDSAEP